MQRIRSVAQGLQVSPGRGELWIQACGSQFIACPLANLLRATEEEWSRLGLSKKPCAPSFPLKCKPHESSALLFTGVTPAPMW